MWLELSAVATAAVIYVLLRGGDRISGARAQELVAEGAPLIDVRTPAEFDADHIDGAKNIPLAQLGDRMGEVGDKTADVVVYCQSGMRSARAKRVLAAHGFTAVHNLGGIGRWQQ